MTGKNCAKPLVDLASITDVTGFFSFLGIATLLMGLL